VAPLRAGGAGSAFGTLRFRCDSSGMHPQARLAQDLIQHLYELAEHRAIGD
jgi:hypothetical protein